MFSPEYVRFRLCIAGNRLYWSLPQFPHAMKILPLLSQQWIVYISFSQLFCLSTSCNNAFSFTKSDLYIYTRKSSTYFLFKWLTKSLLSYRPVIKCLPDVRSLQSNRIYKKYIKQTFIYHHENSQLAGIHKI